MNITMLSLLSLTLHDFAVALGVSSIAACYVKISKSTASVIIVSANQLGTKNIKTQTVYYRKADIDF